MEQGKHGNSDAPSPESDSPLEKASEESAGVGRSYECTFCKRGFTNAQALGGHMNIHRKDKAKAKQKVNQEEAASNKSRYAPSLDHHRTPGNNQRAQMNYQVYLPSANPNFQTGNYLPLWRPVDRFDANLSLGMGVVSPPSGDADGERAAHVDNSNVKENDVDLELRLGHHP